MVKFMAKTLARLFGLGVLLFPALTWAHSSETILSVEVTNQTSSFFYVIDSDVYNSSAGYDRDYLKVETVIRYVWGAPDPNPVTYNYLVAFELLDADGQVVPLHSGANITNTLYVADSVTLP